MNTPTRPATPRPRRVGAPRTRAFALVAAVVSLGALAACGDDSQIDEGAPPASTDGGDVTSPPPTDPGTTDPGTTDPGTTDPGTPVTGGPATDPGPLPGPGGPADDPAPLPASYEGIVAVIDDGTTVRACAEVLESLPPQCGRGFELTDWSWDLIDVERTDAGVTWVDQIHVTGDLDLASGTWAVRAARIPTDADRERLLMSGPLPDLSLPCEPPAAGWPERTEEWPGDEIAALPGYAGAWSDATGLVMVVAFTGDLEAAELAVRDRFGDAVCVVPAERDAAELQEIADRVAADLGDSLLTSSIVVDASGERVEVRLTTPDAGLQEIYDEEFGAGTVRMTSWLVPIDAAG